MGAIGMAGHILIFDPTAWALLRIMSGICIAGCYTVIESWLQAKVTNATRGRAMGLYRVVDMGGSLVAQLLIGTLASMETYVAYNLLTILCCASLLPMALTRVPQPEIPSAPRLRPSLAWRMSPLAVAGVLVAALSSASFRMVGPIYGQEVGLEASQIGLFLAAFVAGGALAQFPAGWLADKYDRRWVLIWLSVASVVSCGVTVAASSLGTGSVMASAAFFGLTTFPVYSVAASHAHDFATSEERVELSAALMFFYAVGAIATPWGTSLLIERFGPTALFYVISIGHIALVMFGLSRMRVRDTNQDRTRYVYAPRTSFTIGRLLRRTRDR
jgi:MFS family permease